MEDVRLHSGTLVADLLLPHAQSIKERRQALRSLTQRLYNRRLAVAQVGPADLWQRAFVLVGAVAGSAHALDRQLDEAERVIFASAFEVGDLRRDVRQEGFVSG
ncbi:DUF503 family protein [bacterium]|nr:DUF503 family protein [bacterium]